MKLLPYSKVKTENLSLLLFTARVVGFFGFLLFLFYVFALMLVLFGDSGFNKGINGDAVLKNFAYGISLTLGLFASSGILAALVSFEYTYTKTKGQ